MYPSSFPLSHIKMPSKCCRGFWSYCQSAVQRGVLYWPICLSACSLTSYMNICLWHKQSTQYAHKDVIDKHTANVHEPYLTSMIAANNNDSIWVMFNHFAIYNFLPLLTNNKLFISNSFGCILKSQLSRNPSIICMFVLSECVCVCMLFYGALKIRQTVSFFFALTAGPCRNILIDINRPQLPLRAPNRLGRKTQLCSCVQLWLCMCVSVHVWRALCLRVNKSLFTVYLPYATRIFAHGHTEL